MLGKTVFLFSLLTVAIATQTHAAVLYVNTAASGAVTNGLSWETAFRNVQDGLNSSSAGDELWVAAGEYREHLTLKEGVALLGGFAGIETQRNQRNWNVHKSILSGSNSGRVLTLEQPAGQPTRVDGFVIRDGAGNYGSGAYLAGGHFIFANNLVIGSRADGPHSGAGIFVDESGVWPEQPLLTLFTAISDQLLKNYSEDLSSTHIPLYPTNRYDAEVHRLLQVAANICDTTTNRGDAYPYYPSVFRPVFTNDNGNIAISGYVEASDAQFISNSWLDLDLAADRALLASDHVRSNANLFGQAIIIGAKKGWPNFNELSMETIAEVSRRLEIRKPNSHPSTQPNETNQMYTLSIYNVFGVEAWNSYTQNFTRPIELHVKHSLSASLTDQSGSLIWMSGGNPRQSNSESKVLILHWPTVGQYQYILPVHSVFEFLPPSVYRSSFPQLELGPTNFYTFQRFQGFPLPDLHLSLTNRLQYFAVEGGRVVDFVNLNKLTTYLDLSKELLASWPDNSDPALYHQLWNTNRIGGVTPNAPTRGILAQIDVSLGLAGGNFYWGNHSEHRREIDTFRIFMGLSPLYGSTGNFPLTNKMLVPFIPGRKIYHRAAWQANDPLIHHRVEHLENPSLLNIFRRFHLKGELLPYSYFSESNLGAVNEAFRPTYGTTPSTNPFGFGWRDHQPSSLLQDTNVFWSEDWNFPSGSILNLASLDRIHRGTPWQTLYTGSHSFEYVTELVRQRFDTSHQRLAHHSDAAHKQSGAGHHESCPGLPGPRQQHLCQ